MSKKKRKSNATRRDKVKMKKIRRTPHVIEVNRNKTTQPTKKRGDKHLGTPKDGDIVRVVKGVHKDRVGKVIKETDHTFLVRWLHEKDERDRPVTKFKHTVQLERPDGTRKITYYFGAKKESNTKADHGDAKQKNASVSVIVEL